VVSLVGLDAGAVGVWVAGAVVGGGGAVVVAASGAVVVVVSGAAVVVVSSGNRSSIFVGGHITEAAPSVGATIQTPMAANSSTDTTASVFTLLPIDRRSGYPMCPANVPGGELGKPLRR